MWSIMQLLISFLACLRKYELRQVSMVEKVQSVNEKLVSHLVL